MTIDQSPNENPVNEAIPDEPEMHQCHWCQDEVERESMIDHEVRRRVTWHTIQLCEACDDNSTQCEDCSTSLHYDDAISINCDYYVCQGCYDECYASCDNCDLQWNTNHYSECPDGCDSESQSVRGIVQSWSFKPEAVFAFMRNGAPRYSNILPPNISVTGFELEMEAVNCERYEGVELANDIFKNWCYFKEDGSLSNGFEMVSHPMSLEIVRDTFPWERLRDLSEVGMRSAQTRTCGLHIHINKSFFANNPTTMYRFMSMFYSNAEQWKKIAGRSESSYASWSEYEQSQMLQYTKHFARKQHAANSDRYVALNLQNRNTIELRFFKGTLRPESFISRIEAVHAVAQYAQETRNNISIKRAHDWERFREWTSRNGFTHFNEYADSKGV